MATPSKKTFTFVVKTPVYVEMTLETFKSKYGGTESLWDRLLETYPAGELVKEASTGADAEEEEDVFQEVHDLVDAAISDLKDMEEEEKEYECSCMECGAVIKGMTEEEYTEDDELKLCEKCESEDECEEEEEFGTDEHGHWELCVGAERAPDCGRVKVYDGNVCDACFKFVH
jgi:hypothetical protein